jgi:hypothetical protein
MRDPGSYYRHRYRREPPCRPYLDAYDSYRRRLLARAEIERPDDQPAA